MLEIQLHRQLTRGLFFQRTKFVLAASIAETPGTEDYENLFFRITAACTSLSELDPQLQGLLTTGVGENFELHGLRGKRLDEQSTDSFGGAKRVSNAPGATTEELLQLDGELFDIPPFVPSDLSELTASPFSVRAATVFDRFEGTAEIVHKLKLALPRPFNSVQDALSLVHGRFTRLRVGLEAFKTRRFGSMLGLAPVVTEKHYFSFELGRTSLYIEADSAAKLSDLKSWNWFAVLCKREPKFVAAVEAISTQLSANNNSDLVWNGMVN